MAGFDHEALREARRSTIELACPFERALLSGCVTCHQCRRLCLGEHEAVSCSNEAANLLCEQFLAAVRDNSRFALQVDPRQRWPFGKSLRAQCGGVLGLKNALELPPDAGSDVAQVLAQALVRWGSLADLPFSDIMRGLAQYQTRRRRPVR